MLLKIKGKTLNIIVANTFFLRLKGLMFKKDFTYGMLFPKVKSIHTFMMKEKIDVIGLDEDNKIIYLKRNVPKNRIITIKRKAKKTSILELPQNASQDLNLGDQLTFISK